MDLDSYVALVDDEKVRHERYAELVPQYYDYVAYYYEKGWGDCWHFAPFAGRESLRESQVAAHKLLVERAGIREGMRVLDVGCGIGGPARSIARLSGADVTGITIQKAGVDIATEYTRREKLADRVRFVHGDAMAMPFDPASFDAVYLTESGCYMPDKALFYREVARVLKPGGVFAGWDWAWTRPLAPAEMKALGEPICKYFACPHLLTTAEIGEQIVAAGLDVEMLEDLAKRSSPERPWWDELESQLASPVNWIATRLSKVLKLMHDSGDLLVAGGKADVFTPLAFFAARKKTLNA